jgi:CheY-like chemotaxis protein
MGGEIGLESELGSGTRFWFRVSFPVDEVRCNPILSDRFSDLEVMVWHPDEAIAKNLSNKLKSAGAKVQHFENIDQLSTSSLQKSTITFLSDTIEPEQLSGFKAQSEYLHPVLLTSIGSRRKSLHQTCGSVRYLNLPIDDRLLIAQLHRNHEDDVSPDLERELPKIDRDVFDGLRILLAEDNVVNQKVIERMLTKQGCRVDVAENGLDAVNMSDSEEYDLIFMDLRMPEKDGIEAVMDIRRRELRENLSRIPIVAMTANAMGGDRDACIDAGMDDYVSKPVQIATLTEVLERWAKIN